MSVYTIKQSRIIALVLILLLGAFLLYTLSDLYEAVLGAVLLYVLFRPFFILLTSRVKLSRPLSVIIIILLSFLIIVMPFLILSIMLVNKVIYYTAHPEIIKSLINQIQIFIGKNINQPKAIEDFVGRAGEMIIGLFPTVIDSALSILLTISMMYFFLYFMLTKYEVFEGILLKYIPFREKNAKHFATELKNVTYANVVGQGMIAFVQGALLALGFIIFSIPDPFFWGLVCFFVAFLPVVGTPLIFVPAGIIELTSGNTYGGIGILIYGVVLITNIDNVMRLFINKKLGNIHPLITITGVVIGIPIFGILGIVYGPLILALFVLLVRLYVSAFAEDHTLEKEKVIAPEDLQEL